MTTESWIRIVFDLSLLTALVFAVLTALVVPHRIWAARVSQAKQSWANIEFARQECLRRTRMSEAKQRLAPCGRTGERRQG